MAEKKNTEIEQRVDPIYLTDNETGEEYILDFCKESVKFMHSKRFAPDEDTINYVGDLGYDFWFYAFRMHHKGVPRNKTDALLDKMGGLTVEIIQRLFGLYNQALFSNHVIQSQEELEKNSKVTVKL